MEADAKLFVMEKLMTHDNQTAVSDMTVEMNGAGSSAQIVSRSVAKGHSVQTFHPIAIGNALCHAHVQCDSIIMDKAQISSIPEINARDIDAQIIHAVSYTHLDVYKRQELLLPTSCFLCLISAFLAQYRGPEFLAPSFTDAEIMRACGMRSGSSCGSARRWCCLASLCSSAAGKA